MKASIEIDVPEWQIGKTVDIYFSDTMHKRSIVMDCNTDSAYWIEEWDHYICSHCDCEINDTHAIEYGCKWNHCPNCGLKMTKIIGMNGKEYEI